MCRDVVANRMPIFIGKIVNLADTRNGWCCGRTIGRAVVARTGDVGCAPLIVAEASSARIE